MNYSIFDLNDALEVTLGKEWKIKESKGLFQDLKLLLEPEQEVRIDINDTEEFDTTSIQLLSFLCRQASRQQFRLQIIGVSQQWEDAFQNMGLTSTLGPYIEGNRDD